MGVIDRAFSRDSAGIPYLRGSALKGKLRWGALRWARTLDDNKAVSCSPENGQACSASPCPFCRLFGSARLQGAVRFSDAYPDEDFTEWFRSTAEASPSLFPGVPASIRYNNGISRKYLRSEPDHLFSTETLPALRFSSDLHGSLDPQQTDLLKQSAAILTYFGSGSSRGLGFCSYRLETL